MEANKTAGLNPEALQVLKRLAPRLAKRAEQVVEAIENAEEVLKEATEDAVRREVGFNFATYYEESKVIGILLDFAEDERRSLLTIDGGLTGEDADIVLAVVKKMGGSRRLRRVLRAAAPKWFRPRVSVRFIGRTADEASYRALLRLTANGAISESFSHDFSRVQSGRLDEADVAVLLITPRFLRDPTKSDLLLTAIKQHRRGEILVIPVIVRPLKGDLDPIIRELSPLPIDGTAVAVRADLENAWLEVLIAIGERIRDWVAPGWRQHGSLSPLDDSRAPARGSSQSNVVAARTALFVTFGSTVYESLRFHLERVKEENLPNGTIIERGTFLHGKWNVALADGQIRLDHAVASVDAALKAVKPEIVVVVSLALGVRGVLPGDIVMASEVEGYATRPSRDSEIGFKAWQLSFPLDQRARMEARKRDWIRRLPAQGYEREPHIVIGSVGLLDSERQHHLPTGADVAADFGGVVAFDSSVRPRLFKLLALRVSQAANEMAVIVGITEAANDPPSLAPAARNASAFAMELLAKL